MIQNTLKELLLERGLSVKEFSKLSDIPESSIYYLIQNPNVIPDWLRVELICKLFQIDIGTLIMHIDDDDERLLDTSEEELDDLLCCFRANHLYLWRNRRDMEMPREKYQIPVVNFEIYGLCPSYERPPKERRIVRS